MCSFLPGIYCRTATYFIALAAVLSPSSGELVIAPRNTESKVGDTTYFNCSTDLESSEIFWHHGGMDIYTGNGILEPYRGRFVIERNESNGSHNLVIHSVEPGDAGEYICADDEGYRERISAQLVVLDNDPDCQSNIQPDGVIGQNVFNIPPDEVHLTCNVTYYGNIPPQMEWKKVGDMNSSIKDGVVSYAQTDNRLIHTLKFTGDISLDNSSYVCQTTRSTQDQYTCTSETIKVLYFIRGNMTEQKVFRGDEITCTTTRNTFPCINQLHYGNKIFDERIRTDFLGEYLCMAKCHIRGADYSFDALKSIVSERTTSPSSLSPAFVAAAVVAIIIVMILAVSIAVLTVHYIKTLHASNKTTTENEHLKEPERIHFHINQHAVARPSGIDGLTVLGSEVFIFHRRLPDVDVFDSRTFKFLRHIKVNGMTNTENIASCSVNKCLYAFTWKFRGRFNAMLRINPISGKPDFWLVDGSGGRVSVASDTNVILNINFESKLKEYTAAGELIREIILDSGTDIFRVWHAVKLPSGLFVICQGCDGDPINRICLLETNSTIERIDEVEILTKFGSDVEERILYRIYSPNCPMKRIDDVKILKEFGREGGEPISRLYHPNGLSVDKEGSILVSDLNTVLLSPDLDKPRILVSEEH